MIDALLTTHFQEAAKVLDTFIKDEKNLVFVEKSAQLMVDALNNGHKILSCGNGGSMCDAIHFAEEMSGRYRENRRALAALALSDVGHVSCVANDYGYDFVFARMVEALGKKGDVLLGISTSGNSKNIIVAAEKAKEIGMQVIILSGKDGGKLAPLADIEVRVPHFGYADRIQEIHIKIIHSWIDYIERKLLLS